MADLVCAHGWISCSFCGSETSAPWRRLLGRFLSRSGCPSCGRRSRTVEPCGPCLAAGFEPLTLFELADG